MQSMHLNYRMSSKSLSRFVLVFIFVSIVSGTSIKHDSHSTTTSNPVVKESSSLVPTVTDRLVIKPEKETKKPNNQIENPSVISEVIPRQKKARRSDQDIKEFRNKLLEVTKQNIKKDDKIRTKKLQLKESESKSKSNTQNHPLKSTVDLTRDPRSLLKRISKRMLKSSDISSPDEVERIRDRMVLLELLTKFRDELKQETSSEEKEKEKEKELPSNPDETRDEEAPNLWLGSEDDLPVYLNDPMSTVSYKHENEEAYRNLLLQDLMEAASAFKNKPVDDHSDPEFVATEPNQELYYTQDDLVKPFYGISEQDMVGPKLDWMRDLSGIQFSRNQELDDVASGPELPVVHGKKFPDVYLPSLMEKQERISPLKSNGFRSYHSLPTFLLPSSRLDEDRASQAFPSYRSSFMDSLVLSQD